MVQGHRLVDGIEDADRAASWYVLRTATRQEAHAEDGLIDAGFAVYMPRLKRQVILRRPRERREVREVPLFEGYLFSGLASGRAMHDMLVDGVHNLVRFGWGAPQALPFWKLEQLVERERRGLFDQTQKPKAQKFEVGEKVTVCDGPFAGFPANITKLSSRERVEVLVSLFGRAVPVQLEAFQVEKVA